MKTSFFMDLEHSIKKVKPTQICVPLTGKTKKELGEELGAIRKATPDLVEWRVDQYEGSDYPVVLDDIHAQLRGIPLLFTWRTHREGGVTISDADYISLNIMAMNSGKVQMIDLELSVGEEICKILGDNACTQGVEVILSYHNFEETPPKEELLSVLERMYRLDMGIGKIAVMPRSNADALVLMNTVMDFRRQHPTHPVIGISMGDKGRITRIAGDFFGSALTFATVRKESAPGQMGIDDVRAVLKMMQ